MENKKYFDNLDGLRAYAALAVVVFHMNLNWPNYWYLLPYGWLWVEIFFIISGFLITNILVNLKQSNTFFSTFYSRRIRRILPLYFLCLIFTIFYWIYKNNSINDLYAYILFIQNWIIWINNWTAEFPAIFGHSWTLTIEQQFYLLWPIFIRYINLNKLWIVCVVGIIFSMISRFYSAELYPWYTTAYSTFSHLDTLLWWSLLAVFYNQKYDLKKLLKYNALIVTFIFLAYYYLTNIFNIPAFWDQIIRSNDVEWPLTMIILTPLCIILVHYLIVSKNILTNALFKNKVVVHLWKISYWIYLYHIFVLYILDYNSPTMIMLRKHFHLSLLDFIAPFIANINDVFIISFRITAAVAYLFQILVVIFIAHFSYTYFERRFLGKKDEKKL